MHPMKRLERLLVAAVASPKPIVPEAGRFLWSWFVEISNRRTLGVVGPNPILWADIEAWARVRRLPLSDTHISILLAMDDAWLEHAYRQKDDEKTKAAQIKHAQPLTPEAFDAVFG